MGRAHPQVSFRIKGSINPIASEHIDGLHDDLTTCRTSFLAMPIDIIDIDVHALSHMSVQGSGARFLLF